MGEEGTTRVLVCNINIIILINEDTTKKKRLSLRDTTSILAARAARVCVCDCWWWGVRGVSVY